MPPLRCGLRRPLVLLVASLAAMPAFAERWYRVEVIVFAVPEYFEREEADPRALYVKMPELFDAIDLKQPDEGAGSPEADIVDAAEETAAGPGFEAFTVLPEQQWVLRDSYRALERSSNYRPLLHTAWLQPSFGSAGGRKVRLTDRPVEDLDLDEPADDTTVSIATPLFTTDGFLRLRIGRILNVDLDLYYQSGQDAIRLSESRRVRFRELHYFDHPGLGALVTVLPVDFDVEEEARPEAASFEGGEEL